MNAMLVIACFVVAAGGCKSDPSDSDLHRFVHGYCFDLEESLRHAAQRHRQLAPALDDKRLSPDQLQRAEADLAVESVGASAETRQARLRDFESRTRFCESVHHVPNASATNYDVRLEAIHVALDQDLRTGAMPSAASTADLLEQFASLVHDINALPLRD